MSILNNYDYNPPPFASSAEMYPVFTDDNHYMEQDSDLARQSREKKNDAVRKSRYKSKQKEQVTEMRIHDLVIDNQCLSQTIHSMQMELTQLKELYQQCSLREYHNQSNQMPSEKSLKEVD